MEDDDPVGAELAGQGDQGQAQPHLLPSHQVLGPAAARVENTGGDPAAAAGSDGGDRGAEAVARPAGPAGPPSHLPRRRSSSFFTKFTAV
eukprot:gene3847-4105_t